MIGLSSATWQYERRGRVDNTRLLARLQVHAAERPRSGYRRLHTLVGREGLAANHKRVYACQVRPPRTMSSRRSRYAARMSQLRKSSLTPSQTSLALRASFV